VPAQFGARPVFEADLLVRVKDARINQAATPAQVLAAVDQIVPFIELPDLMVQKPGELNGQALAAINVGARLGVMGEAMAVPASAAAQDALLRQLADMRVQLRDQHGKTLAEGKGADVLGHPLAAVTWLAGALKAEGKALQPGQYVSLGSFSPLLPPKAGMEVSVHYQGVPGLGGASVRFD
jgi:2-keto-4-pentenoate hydratase